MNYMHISALPGQPSTFWQGESGRWYTSKLAAGNDYVDNAVDPQAYVSPKSFWHEHRFAIAHKPRRRTRDGAFCLDVHVDAPILRRDGECFRKRDGAAVGAADEPFLFQKLMFT